MNLPYPFDNASGVKADAHGTIDLVDAQGKTLARIPMMTAFELSPEAEGDGYADGFGVGYGDGYGDDVGDGSGSGKSK
jgi:hypothetical protein